MRKKLIAACMVLLVLLTSCADTQRSTENTTCATTTFEIDSTIEETSFENEAETTESTATIGAETIEDDFADLKESCDETDKIVDDETTVTETEDTVGSTSCETTGSAEETTGIPDDNAKASINEDTTEDASKETTNVEAKTESTETAAKETERNVEETTTTPETTIAETEIDVWLDLVQASGTVPDETIRKANAILQTYIPEWLLDAFVDCGWKFYVVDYDLATEFPLYRNNGREYGSVKGLTYFLAKRCYVEDDSGGISTVLHEFGHFFDWYAGFYIDCCYTKITATDEFIAIYENESEIFKSAFNYSHRNYDAREFFAEAFKKYFVDTEKLAANCPDTYEFMSQYVNNK